MENSAQQLRNVHRVFAVDADMPAGPVLLVDDTVDSGWTLTVVGAALREAGSGPVHPFALAKTGSA
jgi:ATP-dependent DNA helicase RecQ